MINFGKTTDRTIISLLIVVSIIGILKICHIGVNTFFVWGVEYFLVIEIFKKIWNENQLFKPLSMPSIVYFVWLLWGVIRAVFVAENYWEYKTLLGNVLILFLPVFSLLFYQPSFVLSFIRSWNKLLIPILALFILGIAARSKIHLCMGPVYYILGFFFFMIPSKKWKAVVFIYVITMILADIDARSQVIKGLITIVFAIALWWKKIIPTLVIQIGGISFFLLALTFLYLGISGQYNIFDHSEHKENHTVVFSDGEVSKEEEQDSNMTDTRSFIYFEVITSAINNDYILFGRTPARGNDSASFGEAMRADKGEDTKLERNMNELCHLNIFTWLGLIGVFLYSYLYLQATILSSFFSKNIYIKYLGMLVAFHWLFGWIEDMNEFNLMNVALWMVIGMCTSPLFRKMSNSEFEMWFRSIFSLSILTPYNRYELIKELLKIKLRIKRV